MSDLIDRQAAIMDAESWVAVDEYEKHLQKNVVKWLKEFPPAEQKIKTLPSAQPERKKGNWVGVDDEPCDVYECDQCGTTYDTVDSTWDLPNFCPNCGAEMRGDIDG